ncbi:hypothetical protein Q7P37_002482 [Cladosporium fusiforme]
MAPFLLGAAGIRARPCTNATINAARWQQLTFIRNVSRTSAINRGIRATKNTPSNREDRKDSQQRPREGTAFTNSSKAPYASRGRERSGYSSEVFFAKNNSKPTQPHWKEGRRSGEARSRDDNMSGGFRDKRREDKPLNSRERRKSSRGGERKERDVAEWDHQKPMESEFRAQRGGASSNDKFDWKPASSTGEATREVSSPRGNTQSKRDGNRESASSFDRNSPARRDTDKPDRIQHDNIPVAVPYTTASSQFLYGANSVVAALRGNRRKVYQLFVKKSEAVNPQDRSEKYQLIKLAKQAGVPVKEQRDTRLLDKLSDGRPHNGAVLEVSALSAPPAMTLSKPDSASETLSVKLYGQNAEEKAVNGESLTLKYDSKSWRQPFVLFLDGITDPGNLGGILRTAHFYGVDAVAVAVNTCANLSSPVLAKASSGACEAIPIIAVPKPTSFITQSAKAGWRICAAVAPEKNSGRVHKQLTPSGIGLANPLTRNPCILMLGSEGAGLRDNLRTKSDLDVTIPRGVSTPSPVGVDSINVGVAGAVLTEAFMREPLRNVGVASQQRIF